MSDSLPTAEQLEKLPLRAVVAYAGRAVRRLRPLLSGAVADDILDTALRLIEGVGAARKLRDIRQHPIAVAAQHVADAFASAAPGVASRQGLLAVFAVLYASCAATSVLEAAARPEMASRLRREAAQEAIRAVRQLRALDRQAASAAEEAARADYELLVRVYGERDEVVIGEPVDCWQERA